MKLSAAQRLMSTELTSCLDEPACMDAATCVLCTCVSRGACKVLACRVVLAERLSVFICKFACLWTHSTPWPRAVAGSNMPHTEQHALAQGGCWQQHAFTELVVLFVTRPFVDAASLSSCMCVFMFGQGLCLIHPQRLMCMCAA